jgi:MinD-like ATPase involved in chromosome partitioning or flagellar assembly
VEDENADRGYPPGTHSPPPDRDVEPLWDDEPDAPVHGGRPIPHEAPPAVPLAGQPSFYRPDRPAPIPVPPAAAIPVPPPPSVPQQRPPMPPAHPATTVPPAPTPDAASPPAGPATPIRPWSQREAPPVDGRPAAPVSGAAAFPMPGTTAVPTPGEPAPAGGAGGHVSPDSPWAQPPHRHGDVDQPPSTGAGSVSAAHRPVPGQPPHAAAPPPHAGTPRHPAVDQPANGAIYRPEAPRHTPEPGLPRAGSVPATPSPPATRQVRPQSTSPQSTPPHPQPQHSTAPHLPAPQPSEPHLPAAQPSAPHLPAPQVASPQPAAPGQPAADPFQDLPWVSDGTPTAEEFARRRMAKPADPVATQGPRAMLRKGTMGLVKLAPGRRELEYKQDVEMVRRNFGGLRQVTVVNPKGGAGKTVAVLLLAMTFGQKRGGYVLAWDNNETQGTLGMRAQQDFHARTVRDMMRDLHMFRGSQGRVGDLSQYVRAQGEGMFDVLASDESATAGEMLTADAFAEIRDIVSRFYKLIFVDTGNNVRAQNWQAAIDATDQLVITMSARNDSAETAARMLDHLEQTGRQRLVRQAVTVVSMPPTRKDIDLPAIQRHFAARTRAVLLAPYEKLIDSGEPLRYGQLSANTKDAWLKIAAAVAEGL